MDANLESDTFSNNFVCIELNASPEKDQQMLRVALNENPQNSVLTTGSLPGGGFGAEDPSVVYGDSQPYALALNSGKLWASGRTLKICFFSGSKALQDKVKAVAETWRQYANLKFDWITSGKADIRIDFPGSGGNSSFVGTDCLSQPQSAATMKFGRLKDSSAQDEIRRAVLHEFGHALGCVHEHQSPLSSIEWNKPRIYADMAKWPNQWDEKTVNHNIITKLSSNEVLTRQFDLESIMLYAYPPEWIKNLKGKGTNLNTYLSKEDKAYIAYCYPPYSTDIGTFNTLQVRPWQDTAADVDVLDSKDIPFEPPYSIAPKIALGLTWVDLDWHTNLEISASASDISATNFHVAIASGDSTGLFSGGCSWLELADDQNQDMKTGIVTLGDANKSLIPRALPHKNTQAIKFDDRFDGEEPPKVVVWFSALNMSKDYRWCVNTHVSKVSPFGFSVHVDVGDDTQLYSTQVTWIAYPSTKDQIYSGTFSTSELRNPCLDPLRNENSNSITFPADVFGGSGVDFNEGEEDGKVVVPQLMMAISGLDFQTGHNLRCRLSSDGVTARGFTWHLDSWMDTVMYEARGSYVALAHRENKRVTL